jgi:hypothetical protein
MRAALSNTIQNNISPLYARLPVNNNANTPAQDVFNRRILTLACQCINEAVTNRAGIITMEYRRHVN